MEEIKMVISVSRRTDIPAFYTEWFLNRIKAGYVDVINPFNTKQANRISLKKEDIDCFVFWTKNPRPLLDRIDELDGYNYYFQYTINSYGTDMEPNVPSKSEELINTFIELSNKMLAYWSNFAKYGDPNGTTLEVWKNWENGDNQIMEFGTNIGMIKDSYLELYRIFDQFLEV